MAKGMNHYLQNDSQQGMLSRMKMLSILSAPMSRHPHKCLGEDSRPAEHAKAQDKEQGARSKETGGSREKGGGIGMGENLSAIVKAWDVLPRRAGPVCLWNMGKRSLSRRCGPSGLGSGPGV